MDGDQCDQMPGSVDCRGQINQSTGSIDELFQPRVIGPENQIVNIQF